MMTTSTSSSHGSDFDPADDRSASSSMVAGLPPGPHRRVLTQAQFQQRYRFVQPTKTSCGESVRRFVRRSCTPSSSCIGGALTKVLPILDWLPRYDLKSDLFGDIIAGVTTAIMHIPQGMAYAMLARIPPIHGIYMAFFQCLLYVIFGTSRHISVGTFAVVCIMTGKVVSEYAETGVGASSDDSTRAVVVASTVTMAVGLVELAMYLLRMGALTVVLSDMLVKGFTTGAAVHVLMSQVKSLFGLKLERYSGAGKLLWSLYAIITNAFKANPAAMVISGAAISVLMINNEVIKPRVAKYTRFPIPIELLVVIVGTLASYFGELNSAYDVQVIGNVTTGLPSPMSPDFTLLPKVMVDAVIIAIVAYSVGLSMAQLFAKKHEYCVDANQELVAYGMGNVVSSFFSCAPMSASLSRSLIQENVGGRTQASGLVTASLLLVVLLWLGPVFQTLPNCVLSSIIVVSLKGMFLQFSDLKQVWRTSRPDAAIWFLTFITVVAVDIDIGLAVGVVVSVIVLVLRSQKPRTALLGNVPNTDIYLDVAKYHAAQEELDVKIFQFSGALHFCNREYFRDELVRLSGLDPIQYKSDLARLDAKARSQRSKVKKRNDKLSREANRSERANNNGKAQETAGPRFYADTCIVPGMLSKVEGKETSIVVGMTNDAYEHDSRCSTAEATSENSNSIATLADVAVHLMFSSLVFDMSCVAFVDTASTRTLLAIIKDFQSIQVQCYLTACNEDVLRMLRQCGCKLTEGRFFANVHDAILCIRASSSSNGGGAATEVASLDCASSHCSASTVSPGS